MFEIMMGSFFWVISGHVDLGLRERVWGEGMVCGGGLHFRSLLVIISQSPSDQPAVWR